VTHPTSVEAGVAAACAADGAELDRMITPGPRLSALERLDIYHRAYHARLVECLADDYPALRYALGLDAFETLCREYIARHPSSSPNLNAFGRHMAAFCHTADLSSPSFASDLAALEWAVVEMIHAPAGEPLSIDALAHVTPDAWSLVRFTPSPALRVLRFEFPINGYFQAFRAEQQPAAPDPCPSATAVYRRDQLIWRMDLTEEMASLLESLLVGQTLGESLARLEAGSTCNTTAETERDIAIWFRDWVTAGFFTSVRQ
jgi:hypothetical protein